MSDDWLGELGIRFPHWTVDDFERVVMLACTGLAATDADDIRQDVATSIGRAFRSGIPPGITTAENLDKYIFTAARKRVGQFRLRQAKERTRLAFLDPSGLAGETTKPVYDDRPRDSGAAAIDLTDEQRENVLALLPEGEGRLRDLVRLRLEGLTGQEIARRLGVSDATVSRGLAKCRKYLVDDALKEILDPEPGDARS
jgi:RNA polymerase sigma factor (sigma-70 family)